MFFINNDKPEIGLRSENGAAGSDDYVELTIFYATPLIELFRQGRARCARQLPYAEIERQNALWSAALTQSPAPDNALLPASPLQPEPADKFRSSTAGNTVKQENRESLFCGTSLT